MKISKYRLTFANLHGSAILVYQDGVFKSFLSDVKPPFTEIQLRWLLDRVPALEVMMAERLILPTKGKVTVENLSPEPSPSAKGEGVNDFIALFCDLFKEKTKIPYTVSAADAGKVKNLKVKPHDWLNLLTTYFDSTNFLFINKWSIANLVKYINELRVEAFGEVAAPKKKMPLPYDHLFFVKLSPAEQQEYWAYLRENGYVWDVNASRNGKWVKEGIKI